MIDHGEDSVWIDGVSIGGEGPGQYGLSYSLTLNEHWEATSFELCEHGLLGPYFDLRAEDGRWTNVRHDAMPELDGCTDLDLAFTPLTNTLPIRRLRLRKGEVRAIAVVHIEPPGFEPRRVWQRYTCLAERRRYRFEALDTGFTAEFDVDEDGLVLDYPGLFRRVSV